MGVSQAKQRGQQHWGPLHDCQHRFPKARGSNEGSPCGERDAGVEVGRRGNACRQERCLPHLPARAAAGTLSLGGDDLQASADMHSPTHRTAESLRSSALRVSSAATAYIEVNMRWYPGFNPCQAVAQQMHTSFSPRCRAAQANRQSRAAQAWQHTPEQGCTFCSRAS